MSKSNVVNIRREVITLAWPAVMQGFLSTIILFTDRLILGAYSDSALASMQVSGPVLWSMFSLFGAYGVGVLAVIGRATGAGDQQRAAQTMGTAIGIALILGSLVGLIGYSTTSSITNLIIGDNSAPQAISLANTYLSTVFLSGPLVMLGSVTFVAFQASGDTKTPMWITGWSGLLNLTLSWVLVFGELGFPKLGILGAAIGTVSASACNAFGGFLMIYLQQSPLKPQKPQKNAFYSIFEVSLPAFGEKLLFHTGFLIFAGLVGRLGEEAMTAHQALMAIESLGFIAANGFGIAAGALVAQKLGAQAKEQAVEAGYTSAWIAAIVLTVIGIFFFTFAEQLIGLFSDNPNIIKEGARCMTIAAIAQPLMALTDVFAGSLRGAGDTKTPMKVALIGPLCVRLFACWLFAYILDMGLLGIWIGSTLDWLVRTLWLWRAYAIGRWTTVNI